APTSIDLLPLHDALPILYGGRCRWRIDIHSDHEEILELRQQAQAQISRDAGNEHGWLRCFHYLGCGDLGWGDSFIAFGFGLPAPGPGPAGAAPKYASFNSAVPDCSIACMASRTFWLCNVPRISSLTCDSGKASLVTIL